MERFECTKTKATGFTYLVVLAMLLLVSLALAKLGPAWAEARQREREEHLLRVGRLYVEAIASYHQSAPGSVKRFPAALEDLVWDERHLGLRRHLRTIYSDPMRPGQALSLLMGEDGTIQGVFSSSLEVPLRKVPPQIPGAQALPANAKTYRDWVFAPAIEPSTKRP